MTREFVYTRTFFSNWRDVGLNDADLIRLEEMLIQNPKLGEVIPGTGSARKMRFAFQGRGKRGSARVIYVDYEVGEKICFLGDETYLAPEPFQIQFSYIDAIKGYNAIPDVIKTRDQIDDRRLA